MGKIRCPSIITRRKAFKEPVILGSYPGSGNTWLRHIIEISTGILTGGEYCDVDLAKVFHGECTQFHPSNFSAYKSHFPYFEYRDTRFAPKGAVFHEVFKRAIVIVRDPKEAILSEYKRSKSYSHVQDLSPDQFQADDWLRYVRTMSSAWVNYITYWEEYPGDKMFVMFSNMQTGMGTEVRRILRFLGESPEYAYCYLGQTDGYFKREKSAKTQNTYKPEHIKFMENKALPLYRKIMAREATKR